MAKKYDIDIDGYIGSWFSSKRFVKNALNEIGTKAILCRVNSLGGNLDDAIDIAAQFQTHGNVTCELFSLNASSATVFTLGAKTVRMHANASYLIHKVLSWVDAWGYMNEDDIDAAIENLKKAKDRNSALTLTIAKMYAKKSGKPVVDILNLMKEEKWLSAEEAKNWGFVDEVFEDATVKPANIEDPELTQLLNVAGLPVPTFKAPVENSEEPEFTPGFIEKIKNIFNPSNKTTSEMKKDYVSINSILNVEGLEFKNGKVELTEDQVKNLNDSLKSANEAKEAAENNVTEKENKIKELNTQIETLNKKPGADTTDLNKETDDTTDDDDDMVNTLKSAKVMFNKLGD